MVLPLLAGALIAGGSALSGVYSVGRYHENKRYWDSYFKATGYRPQYPYRFGFNSWMPAYGGLMRGLGGAYGIGYQNYYGSYRSWRSSYDYMYG